MTFSPDSLGSTSLDSNSSRGSSEEKDDVTQRHSAKTVSIKMNSTKMNSTKVTSWSRSQKVEDELSQLWDTGQVFLTTFALGTYWELEYYNSGVLSLLVN